MSNTQIDGRQIGPLNGDIGGSGDAVSVDKIKGTPLSATPPTTGQSLVFNGASWAPSAGGPATALKTTGADVVISGAAPPTTGQVLTATSATAANWQTPAGGSSYVATVVVAAATGTAATDTGNIAAALAAASAAGGGTVLLREGTYMINATLVMPSKITLRGQGRDATFVKADSALGANPIMSSTSTNLTGIAHLTVDMNFSVRGAVASNDISFSLDAILSRLESIRFVNNTGYTGAADVSVIFTGSNNVIDGCEFVFNGATPFAGLELGGTIISNSVFTNSVAGMNTILYCDGGIKITNCELTSSAALTNYISIQAGNTAIHGNIFTQTAGTTTNAISLPQVNTRGSVAGNTATALAGSIITSATKVSITGNAGFTAYTGGTQAGNVL